MPYKTALLAASALFLSACGSNQPLYGWGSYPKALLSYAKNPEQSDKFSAAIEETLRKAEAKRNVPPGLYAEYGYILLEQGRAEDAVIYFTKEHDLWPESKPLMSKIIARVSAQRAEPAALVSRPSVQ